jgi:hypothetical protein
MRTFWKVLTLDSGTYEAIKIDPQGFATTLKIFAAAALILTIGQLTALSGIFQQRSAHQEMQDAAARLQGIVDGRFIPARISEPVNAFAQTLSEVAGVLEAGQPPLGKPVSEAIMVLGQWLGSPFALLAAWLVAGAFVYICAKILSGRGSLREHMALVLLAFAPQVLTIVGSFSIFPALERLAGILFVVAWLWSLIILVAGLRHAHAFSTGRAVGTLVLACVLVGVSGALTAMFWGAVLAGFIGWLL